MRLIQFLDELNSPCLGVVRGRTVGNVTAVNPELFGVYQAFQQSRFATVRLQEFLLPLADLAFERARIDYQSLIDTGRLLAPITEPAVVRLLVSGTGLTHLGSAQQRDAMHSASDTAPKSDSRRMFELGLASGRPAAGTRGAAPEWFYKGDGRILRGPGQPLEIPEFAPDGGEEPEVVGVYVIDDRGVPCRLGFCQGNEWSDHVTENQNYLYLAPSKLRTCSIGPELVTDLAFDDVTLRCRVLREGNEIYHSGELRSGERNMCHALANLEDHHFKFPGHRQMGDVHVHFLGTSRLSYPGRDWQYADGDVVEVSVDGLGEPLRNPIRRIPQDERPWRVEPA